MYIYHRNPNCNYAKTFKRTKYYFSKIKIYVQEPKLPRLVRIHVHHAVPQLLHAGTGHPCTVCQGNCWTFYTVENMPFKFSVCLHVSY